MTPIEADLATVLREHPHHLLVGRASAVLTPKVGAYLAVSATATTNLTEATTALLLKVIGAGFAILIMAERPDDAEKIREQLAASAVRPWGHA